MSGSGDARVGNPFLDWGGVASGPFLGGADDAVAEVPGVIPSGCDRLAFEAAVLAFHREVDVLAASLRALVGLGGGAAARDYPPEFFRFTEAEAAAMRARGPKPALVLNRFERGVEIAPQTSCLVPIGSDVPADLDRAGAIIGLPAGSDPGSVQVQLARHGGYTTGKVDW